MRAVIFDIDGTLADVSHRLHHLDGEKDWDAFFAAAVEDKLIDAVAEVARVFDKSGYAVLIVTARPRRCEKDTRRWLLDRDVPYMNLYMRPNGDHKADNLIKQEILAQIMDDGYEPFLVIDDRPQVVDMWRSMGLVCLANEWNDGRNKYAGKIRLNMMVAPSGAGKTTWLQKNVMSADPGMIVSPDEIRKMYDLGHSPQDLARTFEIAHAQIESRLKIGLLTYLDATNIKRKDRLRVLDLVPKGQLVNYIVIDRRLEDKLADRGNRSEDLVLKHHKTFVSQLPEILRGDDQPNVIVLDRRKHKV